MHIKWDLKKHLRSDPATSTPDYMQRPIDRTQTTDSTDTAEARLLETPRKLDLADRFELVPRANI